MYYPFHLYAHNKYIGFCNIFYKEILLKNTLLLLLINNNKRRRQIDPPLKGLTKIMTDKLLFELATSSIVQFSSTYVLHDVFE